MKKIMQFNIPITMQLYLLVLSSSLLQSAQNISFKAAGVLPVDRSKNTVILGVQTAVDYKNKGLMDYFAGGLEKEDNNDPLKAAIREFYEEARLGYLDLPWGDSAEQKKATEIDVKNHILNNTDRIVVLATQDESTNQWFGGVMYEVDISKQKQKLLDSFADTYQAALKERNTLVGYIRHQMNYQPFNAYLEKDRLVEIPIDQLKPDSIDGAQDSTEQPKSSFLRLPETSVIKFLYESYKNALRAVKRRIYPLQQLASNIGKGLPLRPILRLLLSASFNEEHKVDHEQNTPPIHLITTKRIKRNFGLGYDYELFDAPDQHKKSITAAVLKNFTSTKN